VTSYRGRFAPSPSGWLHLGNARTALFAWARARAAGGAFVMRVEDLDGPRTRPDAVLGNLEELAWLGLDWDEGPDVGGPHEPYLQSRRGQLYEAALARLMAEGHVYECFLTRREVADLASGASGVDDAGEGQQAAPARVYGEDHRRLNEELAPRRRAEGRAPALRFRVPDGTVSFDDGVQGRVEVDLAAQVGDFVVRRADGLVAYQLAVVVDDAAMGITEAARGADLLESTAAQLLLYRALGAQPPAFAHVGLLMGEDGEKLSKRGGALSLHELRAAGADPRAVLGLLAHTLGWSPEPVPVTTVELLSALGDGPVTAPAGPAALRAGDLARLAGVDS
jgi:glutamyl-tRNA synthetase